MVSFVLQIITEAAYDGRNPQASGSYLHRTFNLVRKLTSIEKNETNKCNIATVVKEKEKCVPLIVLSKTVREVRGALPKDAKAN